VNNIIYPWRAVELTFLSGQSYANPYTDVEISVSFRHESGAEIVRPGFWDGENRWKVRFASPLKAGNWQWQSVSAPRDPGLHGRHGVLQVE
jgi:hypothetical protein